MKTTSSENCHSNVTFPDLPKSRYCDGITVRHIPRGGLVADLDGLTIAVEINHARRVSQEAEDAIAISHGKLRFESVPWFLIHCRQCARYILRRSHSARYCSRKCASIHAADSQSSRRAAKQPRRLQATCDICRCVLESQRASKKYCSDRCRQAAWRKWLKPDK